MQADQVVEDFGDAHRLLASLSIGGHRPFIDSCGGSIGLLETMALQPLHRGEG
jgi:hypothetical protein